jgi:predicted metal-dependent TIM-barrel fold hydrolase
MDDLPYILSYGAEDSLMVGSDYGHADQSAEIDAPKNILRMAEAGRISHAIAEKIVDSNARRFYAL